jgi:hypothetical protein
MHTVTRWYNTCASLAPYACASACVVWHSCVRFIMKFENVRLSVVYILAPCEL